jgi:dihydroneopterin aldolase
MNDQIAITGIRGFGYHGLFDSEKKSGQEFIVDIRIEADLSEACQSDQIESTIDYGKVAMRVKELIETGSFNLIERLAEVIAESVKQEFQARAVEVTVHKPSAPVDLQFEDISVTIKR